MRRLLLFLVLTAGLAAELPATTYLVTADGNGDYPTIQAAIDACGEGDIIELADGVFTGEGNRDISFGGKSISVRSLSGNPEACVIDCQGHPEDEHRGFHFHSGEDSSAVLQGVTITGGVLAGC